MKRNKPAGKKLRLSKETVRRLSTNDLKGVAGGLVDTNYTCNCDTQACTRLATDTCATTACLGGGGGGGGGGYLA